MSKKIFSDIKKIIWIQRSFKTLTIINKELIINRNLPMINFYGKTFAFINQIYGLRSIELIDLYEKGAFCELDVFHVNSIIKVLIELNFVQRSSNNKFIETSFPKKIKIYEKLYQSQYLGELNKFEITCLKILDLLTIRPLTIDEIFDILPQDNEEFYGSVIKLLIDLGNVEKLEIQNQDYYLTPLNTYGEYDKYKNYCQKHTSEEIEKLAELLEFCKDHKGIPIGLVPEDLKEIAQESLNLGILHGVNYEFGNEIGNSNFTLIFPTSEEFDLIKESINDFDKIHAVIGLLVYGVYYNPHKIRAPERYISALISRGKVRGTSIQLVEKYKQFNPSIFSGIIDFSKGFSGYLTRSGDYKLFEGFVPKLIPSEENRKALQNGLELFQDNDVFNIEDKSKKDINIFDDVFYYADTAGILTYKKKKKPLQEQIIDEFFEMVRRR